MRSTLSRPLSREGTHSLISVGQGPLFPLRRISEQKQSRRVSVQFRHLREEHIVSFDGCPREVPQRGRQTAAQEFVVDFDRHLEGEADWRQGCRDGAIPV